MTWFIEHLVSRRHPALTDRSDPCRPSWLAWMNSSKLEPNGSIREHLP
jgi:hypothetical protein